MKSDAVFARILEALDSAGIPYMLTGSFASSFHGTPRATQDIDIVVDPTQANLRKLLEAFPDTAYYVSDESAFEALERRGQFNVLDLETGWKIDFIVRKDRPFSTEEFRRRKPIELFGRQLYIATAEDVLIAKLEWAKMGQSDRPIEDAAGILLTEGDKLDLGYVERWVKSLELEEQWIRAKTKGGLTES